MARVESNGGFTPTGCNTIWHLTQNHQEASTCTPLVGRFQKIRLFKQPARGGLLGATVSGSTKLNCIKFIIGVILLLWSKEKDDLILGRIPFMAITTAITTKDFAFLAVRRPNIARGVQLQAQRAAREEEGSQCAGQTSCSTTGFQSSQL
jgi:hypothetical protein